VTPISIVGAAIVVRSETVISAFREACPALLAEGATADLLSVVVGALPKGSSLDLIVETSVVYQALRSCADIISHGWNVDQYCHDPGSKKVIATWKDQRVQTTVRVYDEEGVDSENSPMRRLATREAIQAVHDGVQERDSLVGGQ
jgi:hypothetical protein